MMAIALFIDRRHAGCGPRALGDFELPAPIAPRHHADREHEHDRKRDEEIEDCRGVGSSRFAPMRVRPCDSRRVRAQRGFLDTVMARAYKPALHVRHVVNFH
jgi:hypothetical protein